MLFRSMGMLATVINALALQDALEKQDIPTRVMTAITMSQVAEPYIRRRAIRHLDKGRVVIFAGGTSNPYFSTDTTATLRGLEIHAEVVAKATRVDGVYDKDPAKHDDATKLDTLTHHEALSDANIAVMDKAALGLAMEQNKPVIICDLLTEGNIARAAAGENVGTIVG